MRKILCCVLAVLLAAGLCGCNQSGNDGSLSTDTDTEQTTGGGETSENGQTPSGAETPENGQTPSEGETPESGQTPSEGDTTDTEQPEDAQQYIIPESYLPDDNFLETAGAHTVKTAVYASPNGNGDGSINSPYSLQDALDEVDAGQTLYLRGGTYDLSAEGVYVNQSGKLGEYITVCAYENEKPIITCTESAAEVSLFNLDDKLSYTVIEGLTFANVTAQNVFGIVAWGNGQNHIVIRNNTFSNLKTTGVSSDCGANAVLLMGETKNAVSEVLIENNLCYGNVIGYSEVISVAGNCEYVYVLNNVLRDNTNIGIDFYGNAGYCSDAALDHPRYCAAVGNSVENSISPYADCAGIYVDGADDILIAANEVRGSQYGIEIGAEEVRKNSLTSTNRILVEYNDVHDNTVCGIRIGGYEMNGTGVVSAVTVRGNKLKNNRAEFVIAKVDGVSISCNTVQTSDVLFSTDFSDSYCKNITVSDNEFVAIGAEIYENGRAITQNQFEEKYGKNTWK
ncbi:MAG: right-handed parallel beta-helix repeat-containing protein [Candidatus Coproplasma sp.]